MRVKNITSQSSGRKVANQFIIEDETSTLFQSYSTVIAKRCFNEKTGKVETFLDENSWDFSKTTGRYRNQFLGETKRETEKKIKDGIYKLDDLNR